MTIPSAGSSGTDGIQRAKRCDAMESSQRTPSGLPVHGPREEELASAAVTVKMDQNTARRGAVLPSLGA